jgi:hypothetical protein
VQRESLGVGHETFRRARDLEQASVHDHDRRG